MFNLFDLLFGCTHGHLSFPMSARAGQRRPAAAAMTGTYVVCLECGKEFAYDWGQMKVVTSPEAASAGAAAPAPARRAA